MNIKPNIKLKTVLFKKDITQRNLAFGSNIDESRISRIIKGYEIPTSEMKESIAAFLETEIEELFEQRSYLL